MGVVYLVHDIEMGLDVALKTLPHRDPELLYTLKQEFRALAEIRHPNLVELYELTVSGEDSFFTMEFVDGAGFLDYVHGGGEQQMLARLVHAAGQLVRGLAALHAAGKLHRDVKPSNAMVDREGRLVLLDFGLATALNPDVFAQAEGSSGTVAYMSPEVLRGRPATPAVDFYAMGVVLFETLAGRHPFLGLAAEQMRDKMRSTAPRLSEVGVDAPAAIDDLVAALLSPEPAERPEAGAILATLERLAPEAESAAPQAAPRPSPRVQPFVGRTSDLERLRQAASAVAPGHPMVVHVHGPSGIGKSELTRRFLTELEAGPGTVVLRSRCHPHETVPYNAFDGVADCLSGVLLDSKRAEVAALVPAHAAALTKLFPVLARVPDLIREAEDTPEEAVEARRRGFAAFRELLGRLSAAQRTVVWIDDFQWIDDDSIALLRELLTPPDLPPVLILLSYRGDSRDRIRSLFEGSDGTGLVPAGLNCEVALAPLAVEEIRSLAAILSGGHRVDIDAVADEAQGSPFFVNQLVSYLSTAGAEGPVPSDLASLMSVRLARLDPASRTVLEIVSVAGQPIERATALAATGLDERSRLSVITLEKEQLLRSTEIGARATLEIYHDRIREVLIEQLPAPALRARHAQLATTLRGVPEPDPLALFRHCLGAGETREAAGWATEAARRAESALAFSEAASLYERALTLGEHGEEESHALRIARATALVNAGHGAEAAPEFLRAAERGGGDAADLRRRAAEQYMVTGHIDEGTAILDGLLADFDLPNPRNAGVLAGSTLARLLLVALRRRRLPGSGRAADASVIGRSDLCHAAAKGLVLVDPFRGLFFAVLGLRLGMQAGDLARIGRGFAVVGAALMPAGGIMAGLAARLLEDARGIAGMQDEPYLDGFSRITLAQKRMTEARWREMLTLCDEGVDLLRSRCRGVGWEIEIGRMAALRALEELGELRELERRVEQALRESEEKGDLYGTVTQLLNQAFSALCKGDADGARARADRAIALWTREAFQMQHFYAMRVHCHCDLMDDRPDVARRRLEETWPAIEKANLLRHSLLRVDAHLLAARVNLALAASDAAARADRLRHTERHVRALTGRSENADVRGHAALLRAAIAALESRPAAVEPLLRAAVDDFERAGMRLAAAAARWRLSARLDGEAAEAMRHEAEAPLLGEGVADVRRWLRIQAPGFA